MSRLTVPSSEGLNRYVGYSVAVHVLLLLVFTVKALFFSGEPIEYQSAVRVDLIGLPDKVVPEPAAEALPTKPEPEPAKAEPKTEPKADPKAETIKNLPKKEQIDPETVNLNKTRNRQKDALAKLKQMDAFDKIKNDLEKDQKKAASKQVKGNAISSGSQLSGLSKLQAETYIGDVDRHIRQNWSLPKWLSNKNLSARIRVRFDEKGQILSAQIVKSSGNPSFDEIVVDTVHKSAPLPAPPDKFVRLMNLEGILFGFPE